jgi:THO complex subunit 2
MAPPKRKRNDRASVDSGENRPSPHRPGSTTLGQHDREPDMRNGGGGRRPSRGGRGGGRAPRNERRNSTENPNRVLVPQRTTPGPMSPPAPRSSSATQIQPQAPRTPSPAPIEDTPPPETKRELSPYDYSQLTDDRVTSWATTGRQEVIAAGLQALDDLDVLDLSLIFQELVRAALDRRIDATDAGTCVKEILATPGEESSDTIDGSTLFLDSVSIIADNEPYDSPLQRLLSASGISPTLMRQTLDSQLLQNLGLTRNTFIKAGIRQVTNILYRQANHNLLREETEGYSKLVTELFTTSGSEPPTSEVVEDTFERVKGLIGTFDLDVGRVLDVTLDVFAAVLIKQFRFFIKFLRVSSWWPRDTAVYGSSTFGHDNGGLPKWALPGSSGWTTTVEDEESNMEEREERDRKFWERAREIGLDAFFELGGRHAVDEETKKSLLAGRAVTDTRLDGDLQWIEATGTLPPSGNRVAAQLLGFKLRFYASEAREKDDVLPANLMYLTALLVKIGFISLRDIYPHLWPLDEDMPAIRDARMKDIAEKERLTRPGAAKNALMTAGALADDTVPTTSRSREIAVVKPDTAAMSAPTESEDKAKETLPEPNDQKVQLLTNLLTIGALPESLFMLGRFPWLPEAYPELYELLHRILHHSINKVYEASQVTGIPLSDYPSKKIADVDQGNAPKGQVRRTEIIPRKPLRWPFPDKSDTNDGVVYRFYWDEWADNVPVCQNVDDIFVLCTTLLNFTGINIGRDAVLLSKFATIGTKSLSQDRSEENLARWQDLLKRLLVPALSLTKSNASVVNEVYDMLRYYPTPVRFSIYAEWFEGATSRQPALVTAFSRARLETISTMKRISTTNLTLMARTLAKTAYANPGIAFKVALGQIQSYSNLTEVVVECAKYFTDLGYDVLIWSLMSSLGDKNRSHTRDDSALLTSRWLIALSKFAGKVFKRYSIMNPTPILQYVNDQLYRGNSTDLIILEELIAQMSGVVSDADFTDSQLSAMTGGELLRRETLIRLKDRRFESTKTAKSLMRSLIDTKLAGELLISIAQHRQTAIYSVSDDDAHIKYLATMVDETQRVLVQYLDLLRSNLSVEQFDALVPSTAELMAEFGLEPSLAFLIGRASYAHRMTILQAPRVKDSVKEMLLPNGTNTEPDGDGDITMEHALTLSSEDVMDASLDTKGDSQSQDQFDDSVAVVSPPSSSDSWREALMPLIEAVQTVLPEGTWRLLNPELYVVFWQLSLSDINDKIDAYVEENSRLIAQIKSLMNDVSRSGVAKKEETRKILEKTKDDVFKESGQQILKYKKVKSRLIAVKSEWFNSVHGNDKAIADALLEACFLPRLLLSPIDAIYCFKFIKLLHNTGFRNFPILAIYTHLFHVNRLQSIIFACTIREAENFGRFLKQILGDLATWHASKSVYELEAFGQNRDRSGFSIKVGKDEKQSTTLLDYEEFRRQLLRFHKSLFKALHDCLSGTEWMHIRNAITVLKGVIEHFPAVNFIANRLELDLKDIAKREQNEREDLSLLANALMPDLMKRKAKCVIPQAFANGVVSLS